MDNTETTPKDATTASRWFQRVLPVTAVAVVVIVLGALISPAFRDQVELSTSRKSQPFVELYFARTPAGAQAVCTRKGASVRVRFAVASHLDKRQGLAYRVSLLPSAKGAKAQRRAGTVRVTPDTTVQVTKRFALPRSQGYTVSVRLPALDQQLRAHCSGRRS